MRISIGRAYQGAIFGCVGIGFCACLRGLTSVAASCPGSCYPMRLRSSPPRIDDLVRVCCVLVILSGGRAQSSQLLATVPRVNASHLGLVGEAGSASLSSVAFGPADLG